MGNNIWCKHYRLLSTLYFSCCLFDLLLRRNNSLTFHRAHVEWMIKTRREWSWPKAVPIMFIALQPGIASTIYYLGNSLHMKKGQPFMGMYALICLCSCKEILLNNLMSLNISLFSPIWSTSTNGTLTFRCLYIHFPCSLKSEHYLIYRLDQNGPNAFSS